MWRSWSRRCQPTIVLIVACTWCWAGRGSAAEGSSLLLPLDEQSRQFWIAERGGYRSHDLASVAVLGRSAAEFNEQRQRPRLDLSPIAEGMLNFLRDHGLP